VINWQKSSAYWKSALEPIKPQWTNGLGVTWAEDANISKILGAPFGMFLTSKDVNAFLHNRITKKLIHWTSIKANPTGRAVIVNSILLGACYFFFSI
jgi:hypothetical protein